MTRPNSQLRPYDNRSNEGSDTTISSSAYSSGPRSQSSTDLQPRQLLQRQLARAFDGSTSSSDAATPQDDICCFFDFASATETAPTLEVDTIEAEPLSDFHSQGLDLTGLHKPQLLQRFYDLYFGTSISEKRMFEYELLSADDPTKLATNIAIETVCLAQIATTFPNPKLTLRARQGCDRSLHLLQCQIQGLHATRPDEDQLHDITGALYGLTIITTFDCIETNPKDWMQYTRGVLQIAENFGTQSIYPPSALANHYGLRHLAFSEALIRRQPVKLKMSAPASIPQDSPDSLLSHATEVPGLLRQYDRAVEKSARDHLAPLAVLFLLAEIERCLSQLKQWFLEWVKSHTARPHYRTVSTKSFPTFSSLAGSNTMTFPLAYEFARSDFERDLRIYSLCALQLNLAIVDINAAFPTSCCNAQAQLQLREAKSDAGTCATDLCMLVPWCSKPQNGTFAAIHSFLPLYFAARYFERVGIGPQLAWCRQVRQSLRARYGVNVEYP